MADLEDLIMRQLKNDEVAMYTNPWVNAGIMTAEAQIAPQNNLQAILIPALQGAVSGGLVGYGQRQVKDQQFRDYSKLLGSPVAEDAKAPESWDSRSTLLDVYKKQKEEELAQDFALKELRRQQEIQDALTKDMIGKYGVVPEFDATGKVVGTTPLEGLQDYDIQKERRRREALLDVVAKEEEIKGSKNPYASKGGLGLSAKTTEDIAITRDLIDRGERLAAKIDKVDPSWLSLQGSAVFSKLDKSGIRRDINDLLERVTTSITGAAAPEAQMKRLKAIVAGDASLTGKEVKETLEYFVDASKRMHNNLLDTSRQVKEGTLKPYPLQDEMQKDAPVVVINGQRGRLVKKN